VALSGWLLDTWHPKFGLSKLAACYWDWYCQKADVLFSPRRISPRRLSWGLILSKDNLLSCSIQRRNLAAPVPITWHWHRFPCHFVWELGVGRATLCHLVRWLWNDKIGTPLLPCLACLALTQVFPATLVHSLGVDTSALCHLVWRFKRSKQN